MERFPRDLDHLVYATPDLEGTSAELAEMLGARLVAGGRHPGWGTRNHLLGLGAQCYLEVIGPDPEQPAPGQGRPFLIDTLKTARLVTWACRSRNLEDVLQRAAGLGLDLGESRSGSRRKPDGGELTWTVTDLLKDRAGGVIPFFMDWGTSDHPAASLPGGCSLVELRLEHPEPGRIEALLRGLGIEAAVWAGEQPGLQATIACPRGTVLLR